MGEYKKINGAEVVVLATFLFGLYIMNDILDGTLVGIVAAWLFNFASTTGTEWFFKRRGDPGAGKLKSFLIQFAIDLIPLVPGPISAFLVKAYWHNHPKNAPLEAEGVELAS
ncbi:hypothetical protein M1432_02670 [Patescibacteria group bacterium]|nr:hypothetical protein [Patescibacteria group bacterium]